MATQSSNSAVLDDLIQEMGAGDIAISEAIKLSPPLVLTACLLYIMASDGKIQEQESSQLQQVIGGNDGLLAHALAYVKAFPVEKFLEDAPSVLSQQDKLCIMANVYDSMLADGTADKREHEIFNKFREAFDLKKSDVNLIVEVVTLKNNKAIFGDFKPVTSDKLSDLTPHLAMAVSIVYMMSADGSIGQEEIGQLEAMVGEFEGLQEFALQLVRKIKRGDFLNHAKHALDKPQRLCVLLNVCDSMMADEDIGMLEDKLFVSMLDAFAVKESAFKKYYEVLELKNIKPFNVSDFEYSIEHVRTLSQQEQKGIVIEDLDDQSEVGIGIQRTMDSNTERVTNDFGSDDTIHQVQDNATHELENQRSSDIKVDPNLQKALSGSDTDENIQAIGGASNTAVLKVVPTDDRVENLQKVVDELSSKLNKFEAKNKSLLNNIRADTNKESSKDPAFASQASSTNKTKVANEATKDNLQSVNAGASATNKALVAKEGVNDNLQSVAGKAIEANKAAVAKEAIKDNKAAVAKEAINDNKAVVAKEAIKDNNQAIASSAASANKAGVAKEAIEDNLQSAAGKANEANKATVAKEAIKDNKAAVAKEAIKDNNQAIASTANGANKAGVAKEAIEDNLQSAAGKANEANKATVAKEAIKDNKAAVAKETIKDNNQAIASTANGANKAGVAKEAIEDNLQSAAGKANEANKAAVAKEAIKDNKAAVAKEAIKDNNQSIASTANGANKAGVAKEAIEDNLQSAARKANESNMAGVAKEALDDNLQSVPVKPSNTNDARVAKTAFTTNRQPIGNISRLSQASGGTRPLEGASGDSTDALEMNSEGAFASQTEVESENLITQDQVDTSTANESPIVFKKRQSSITKLFRNKKPSKYSFAFYTRVLATFVVMALWTSNIAATRLDTGSMVFGHLLRISPDELDLR